MRAAKASFDIGDYKIRAFHHPAVAVGDRKLLRYMLQWWENNAIVVAFHHFQTVLLIGLVQIWRHKI